MSAENINTRHFDAEIEEKRLSLLIRFPGKVKIVCTSKWLKAYVDQALKYQRFIGESYEISIKEGYGYCALKVPKSIMGLPVEIEDCMSEEMILIKI